MLTIAMAKSGDGTPIWVPHVGDRDQSLGPGIKNRTRTGTHPDLKDG